MRKVLVFPLDHKSRAVSRPASQAPRSHTASLRQGGFIPQVPPWVQAAPSTLSVHRERANLQFANVCVHERHLAGLLGIEISERNPRDPDLVNGECGPEYAF